jgi:hypothetical protein
MMRMEYLRLKRFKEKNISMANGCTEILTWKGDNFWAI